MSGAFSNGVSQNGAGGSRATWTVRLRNRASGSERVKCPTKQNLLRTETSSRLVSVSWLATRVSPNASGTSTSGNVFYSNRRERRKSTCDCWRNILMIPNATRSSRAKWVGPNCWMAGIGARNSMRHQVKTRKRTILALSRRPDRQSSLKNMICIALPLL